MSTYRGRRRLPSGIGSVNISTRLPVGLNSRLDTLARRLGVAKNYLVVEALEHLLQETGDGIPSWWKEPVEDDQLELPGGAAAKTG